MSTSVMTETRVFAYGVAVLATAAAALLRLALAPLVGDGAPFLTFFVALLVVVWYCGLRAALLCIALSAVAGTYFFVSSATTSFFLHSDRADRFTVAGFILVSIAVAFLIDLQRRTQKRLEAEVVRRKAAEATEREQRQWFETTLASIGDAVVATDGEANVIFMNGVASELTGWDASRARGAPLHNVFRIVNEQTGVEAENPIKRVIEADATVSLANHTVLISRDDRRIPIDDSGAPIKRDGRIAGAVLVFRDVSARRRAEHEAAYLAAIVESSDDAIIGTSHDGIIQSWNSGAERLYGYVAADMIGRNTTELVPPDRRHEEDEILSRLGTGAPPERFETVRLRKDGALVAVSLTISPIRNGAGRIIGVSHVSRDITEQKKIAENLRQTQKLESLGVLAGGIAHDFNNLLVGILGNASLVLAQLGQDSILRHPTQEVLAAGERAAELIQQMLAYSGRGRFVVARIDFSKFIQGTLPLVQAAIPRTVTLRLALEENLPAVEGDPSQIQQLVMNLVINGAEAIPDGSSGTVTIATRLHHLDPEYIREHTNVMMGGLIPGGYVSLEIGDTGSGMDEATRARMFDPFFTTKFTGRGLGLAAVLGIVRGHGGAIEVRTAPGRGTVFRVFFPALAATADDEPRPRRARDLSGRGAILVIDDEQMVRSMAQGILEHYGYRVLLAANGQDSLELFRQEAGNIGCVLLDMTMPVMSGEETLSRLRALRTDIPVILSSGFTEAEAMRRFEGKTLAGFIQKPYTAAALAEKVKDALGQSEI